MPYGIDRETLWEEFMSYELSLEQEAARLEKIAKREMTALAQSEVARLKARNLYQRKQAGAEDATSEDNRGPCEICGRVPKEGERSNAWDHDHSTGKFRGWLCVRCNIGIGHFQDSEDLLQKAIAYLKK